MVILRPKLLVVIALIQIVVQFVMLRPTDPWWTVPVLALVGSVLVVGIGVLAEWLAR